MIPRSLLRGEFIAGSSSEAFAVNSGPYGYQLDGVVVYVDPNGS